MTRTAKQPTKEGTGYKGRLDARGLTKTPRMKDLRELCHQHDHRKDGSPHYGGNAA